MIIKATKMETLKAIRKKKKRRARIPKWSKIIARKNKFTTLLAKIKSKLIKRFNRIAWMTFTEAKNKLSLK